MGHTVADAIAPRSTQHSHRSYVRPIDVFVRACVFYQFVLCCMAIWRLVVCRSRWLANVVCLVWFGLACCSIECTE